MGVSDNTLIGEAEAILKLATTPVRRQSRHGLTPIEEFFVSILETGVIPNAEPDRPVVLTSRLVLAARQHWFLRDLTSVALGQFLRNQGLVRHRMAFANCWIFPKLAVARKMWEERYGARTWPARPVEWEHVPPFRPFTSRQLREAGRGIIGRRTV
jgi:hypothetical protein